MIDTQYQSVSKYDKYKSLSDYGQMTWLKEDFSISTCFWIHMNMNTYNIQTPGKMLHTQYLYT